MNGLSPRTIEKIKTLHGLLLDLLQDQAVYNEFMRLRIVEVENPLVLFGRYEKLGNYDEVPDDIYVKASDMANEASLSFHGDVIKFDYPATMIKLFQTIPGVLDLLYSIINFQDLHKNVENVNRSLLEMQARYMGVDFDSIDEPPVDFSDSCESEGSSSLKRSDIQVNYQSSVDSYDKSCESDSLSL